MNDFKDAKVFTGEETIAVATQDSKSKSTDVSVKKDTDIVVIDSMIATANKFPRSVTNSLKELSEIALRSPKVAASCFYKLPRGGKIIKGKSVRLAEMAQYCWGNIHSAARPVGIEYDAVIAEGAAFDVQRNIQSIVTIRRKIVGNNGKRFNRDMINITMLAALSIAKREAIFDIIPEALIEDVYDEAMKIAVGDVKSLPERRAEGMEAFAKLGIVDEQLLKFLEVESVDGIDLEKFETMLGIFQGIKNGDVSIDEVFPPSKSPIVSGDIGKSEPKAKKEDRPEPEKEPEKESGKTEEPKKADPGDKSDNKEEKQVDGQNTKPPEETKAESDPVDMFARKPEQETKPAQEEKTVEPEPEDEDPFDDV